MAAVLAAFLLLRHRADRRPAALDHLSTFHDLGPIEHIVGNFGRVVRIAPR